MLKSEIRMGNYNSHRMFRPLLVTEKRRGDDEVRRKDSLEDYSYNSTFEDDISEEMEPVPFTSSSAAEDEFYDSSAEEFY